MKKLASLSNLPLLVLAAGLTGALARAMMYLLGRDETGLLVSGQPLQALCWFLSFAVALCLWMVLRNLESTGSYSANFPQNRRVLPVAILTAGGILVSILPDLDPRDGLTLLQGILGLLSATALITIGIGRAKGKRPKFFLYGTLCLFYALHMILCYQSWSSNPQIADYCFSLLACVFLTISAYQRTAFCAGMGNRRAHLFACLMAGFFCILCISASEHPWLYLTGGCYFLTDLTVTIPHTHQEDNE